MYKVVFLPLAKKDMTEIAGYIGSELSNPAAALRLAEEMIKAADKLGDFPYMNPVYSPIRPLKIEYRRMKVRNYLMLYCVNEPEKLVTVMRVIYARRDYEKLLK